MKFSFQTISNGRRRRRRRRSQDVLKERSLYVLYLLSMNKDCKLFPNLLPNLNVFMKAHREDLSNEIEQYYILRTYY